MSTLPEPRRARIRALAKINLALEVMHKRPDGFHNLRTLFHTISLADTLELEWEPGGRRAVVELAAGVNIPNNLAVRAAELVLKESGARGHLRLRLQKSIPMGGGLGGGSADAAAVLLALPVLTGRALKPERLHAAAASLGSDVPFFLLGGAALGLDRGTELYPLPDFAAGPGLVVVPEIHVSTAEAYAALGRGLTPADKSHKIDSFQLLAWSLGAARPAEEWSSYCENHFEPAVFLQHPQLRQIKQKLRRAGARPALLTGSGAAVFGLFADGPSRDRAAGLFTRERVFPITLVNRKQYHALWWKQLAGHIDGKAWPLRSRYAE